MTTKLYLGKRDEVCDSCDHVISVHDWWPKNEKEKAILEQDDGVIVCTDKHTCDNCKQLKNA